MNKFFSRLLPPNVVALMIFCAWPAGVIAQEFSPKNGFSPGFERSFVQSGAFIEFSGTVYDMKLAPDGKFYLGGDFTVSQSSTRVNIARFNADGTLDNSWVPATVENGTVLTLALQDDGKLVLGGDFTQVGGLNRRRIARLNADGDLDLEFASGTGFDDTVRTVDLQADGSIFVGGDFNAFDGTIRSRIALLASSGELETNFNPNSISGENPQGSIYALAVQSDGKVLVGSRYNAYLGTTRNGIFRLNIDGTLDTTFSPPGFGFGSGGTVRKLAIYSDGKILASGDISQYGQVYNKGIFRINKDASVDPTFDPETDGIFVGNEVLAMQLLPDGKILIAGEGSPNSGWPGIALLNTNGSLDSIFNPGVGFPKYGPVHALANQSDGKFLAAGAFLSYSDTPVNGVVRMTGDGSIDFPFLESKIRIPGTVHSVSVTQEGKFLVGGLFNHVNGAGSTNLAFLNTDGSLDSVFSAPNLGFSERQQNGLSPAFVTATAVQQDGKLVVGKSDGGIVRLDQTGAIDVDAKYSVFILGFPGVEGLALQSDGKLIANFGTRLYRFTTDATVDPSFSNEETSGGTIEQIAMHTAGKIIVAGDFTSVAGEPRNRIARFNSDGTLDTSFDPGSGFNNSITALSVQSDGKIVVGGNFTVVQGAGRNRIARLNEDGSIDESFVVGSGFNNVVESLQIREGGRIVAAGPFTAFSGTPRRYFARLNPDGSLDQSFTVPSIVSGEEPPSIPSLVGIGSDGILAGGSWLLFERQIGGGLVWIAPPPPVMLGSPNYSPGSFGISLTGVPGSIQSVRRATSINGPWTEVDKVTLDEAGSGLFEEANPPVGNGFYRTIEE